MSAFEQDVFCRECGALIDHQTSPKREFAENGFVVSLLAADAMRAHRETGCPGTSGWRRGPITETQEAES